MHIAFILLFCQVDFRAGVGHFRIKNQLSHPFGPFLQSVIKLRLVTYAHHLIWWVSFYDCLAYLSRPFVFEDNIEQMNLDHIQSRTNGTRFLLVTIAMFTFKLCMQTCENNVQKL